LSILFVSNASISKIYKNRIQVICDANGPLTRTSLGFSRLKLIDHYNQQMPRMQQI